MFRQKVKKEGSLTSFENSFHLLSSILKKVSSKKKQKKKKAFQVKAEQFQV